MSGARTPKYNWDEIFDKLNRGHALSFRRGQDFECLPEHWRRQAQAAAATRELRVTTSVDGDRVSLERTPQIRHDWDALFDGHFRFWPLSDFPNGVAGFRVTIARQAKRRGVTYKSGCKGGDFWLQARTRNGIPLPLDGRPRAFGPLRR